MQHQERQLSSGSSRDTRITKREADRWRRDGTSYECGEEGDRGVLGARVPATTLPSQGRGKFLVLRRIYRFIHRFNDFCLIVIAPTWHTVVVSTKILKAPNHVLDRSRSYRVD